MNKEQTIYARAVVLALVTLIGGGFKGAGFVAIFLGLVAIGISIRWRISIRLRATVIATGVMVLVSGVYILVTIL